MTNVQQSSLRPGVDLLWQEGARLAGLDACEVASAGWALLSPPSSGSGRRGGFSELNNDGSPAQLCLSQSRDGTGLRMLVDPAWSLVDAPSRLAASRDALASALARGGADDLAPACEALLTTLLLDEGPALYAYPSSLLWIGVGLGQPGCAVYVDVRPLGDAVWDRTRDWLQQVLPNAEHAVDTLTRLRPHVQLSSIGVEGISRKRARAKLYWRLREPMGLSALGLPLLDDPVLAAFLATAIGEREFPLSGLVMSAGFDFAAGVIEDTKIDLCGHCMPQSAASWLALLERVSGGLGLKAPPVHAALREDRCGVAFLGAGLDRHGHHRLNIYLKPSGLSLPALERRALHERIASACAYLCELQAVDGSFADYRLPVGESTQWVSAFVGLALAEAALAVDLPWAFSAAERTADWLTQDRPYAAGWGYNETTGIDADSTGFAIRLLRATGREVALADQQSLLRHWREDGGFATYIEGPQAWGQAHPCVTAAACLALDEQARRALSPALQAYVARTALPDGSWPAYWWRTHHYSTWHHLLLQRRLGRDTRGTAPAPAAVSHPSPGAFELAYAAGIAHFRNPGSAGADQQLRELLRAQRVDGAWTGGFNLRVTDPACAAPWQQPVGDLYRDLAGSITTASALFVLTEVLRG